MKCVITSCNRHELLIQTLESLWGFDEYIIWEDSPVKVPQVRKNQRVVYSIENQGQTESINQLYQLVKDEKYVMHAEDDWVFQYTDLEWIQESIEMIESFDLIKVQCRHLWDNPHKNVDENGIIQPWVNGNDIWNGWTYNPGITDVQKFLEFLPNHLSEYELDKKIHYNTGQLMPGVCRHIGYEQSTRI